MEEEVAFKDFLTADNAIAATASLLKSEIVADMLASGATGGAVVRRQSPSLDIRRSPFCCLTTMILLGNTGKQTGVH